MFICLIVGAGRWEGLCSVSHSYSHKLFVGFWVFAVLLFCFSTHTLKCFTSMSVVNGGITACKHFEPGRAKYTSRVFAPKRPRGLVAPEKGRYSLRTVQREAFCCVFARMWGSKFCLLKGRNGPFRVCVFMAHGCAARGRAPGVAVSGP